jgi:hypothetical protein
MHKGRITGKSEILQSLSASSIAGPRRVNEISGPPLSIPYA